MLDAVVMHGGIFGKNGDAALPLQVVGVHHPFGHRLILAEDAALFEHLVHQGGLAMVNVGDNGDVSQIFANDIQWRSFLSSEGARFAGSN